MEFTRRDFGKIAMAAVPAAAGLSLADMARAAQSSKIDGVQIGTITYSFRGAPPPTGTGVAAPDMPATMQKIGLSEVELMSGDAEIIAGIPQAPGRGGGGFGGGRGGSGRGGGGFGGRGGGAAADVAAAPNGCPANTPSGRDSIAKSGGASGAAGRGGGGRGPAAMTPEQEAAQKAIADWKMAASATTWKGVKKKFNDAGVEVQILCYNMNINSTKDDEIDYAFQMARDLGVRAMSCSTTVAMAKRVAPFADKYKIIWAGHGHANIYDDEEFAKPETFSKIMSFSKYIGVNLDIGHFTQAGFDPMTYIPQIHDKITNIHLKDSMKPDKCGVAGATQPWGQGQTAIKDVLLLMRKNKYTFPANIELEYRIPEGSDSATEVAKCYEFCKKALA
jgi:sugar phosphate isomerase/epimerase